MSPPPPPCDKTRPGRVIPKTIIKKVQTTSLLGTRALGLELGSSVLLCQISMPKSNLMDLSIWSTKMVPHSLIPWMTWQAFMVEKWVYGRLIQRLKGHLLVFVWLVIKLMKNAFNYIDISKIIYISSIRWYFYIINDTIISISNDTPFYSNADVIGTHHAPKRNIFMQ